MTEKEKLDLKLNNIITDTRVCGVIEGFIYGTVVSLVAFGIFIWYIK